jgi:hypothetical protein
MVTILQVPRARSQVTRARGWHPYRADLNCRSMGLRSLHVHGFRTWRNVRWRPGKLSLLVGPAGSGVSHLCDALALARDAARGELAVSLATAPPEGAGESGPPARRVALELERVGPGGAVERYHLVLERVGPGGAHGYVVAQETLERRRPGAIVDGEAGHGYLLKRERRRVILFDGQGRFHLPPGEAVDEGESALPLVGAPWGDPAGAAFCDWLAALAVHRDGEAGAAAALIAPAAGSLVAIARPEDGVAPSRLGALAALAAAAATRAQVVLVTRSPELVEALGGHPAAAVAVARLVDGETRLVDIDIDDLRRCLRRTSLAALQQGEGAVEPM